MNKSYLIAAVICTMDEFKRWLMQLAKQGLSFNHNI